jgi:hypothetical protein
MITRCTITGLNDVGLILQVNGLFREFPFLEIGVPFSETRAGRENRFPSPEDVMTIVQQLDAPVAPMSAAAPSRISFSENQRALPMSSPDTTRSAASSST